MSAKIITLGNAKGGVSKSTLISLFCTYLHNNTNYKVCAFDLDYFQATLMDQRNSDLKNEELDQSKLYDLVAVTPSHLLKYIDELKDEYDYIFLDVPGNMEDDDLSVIYRYIDYMFIPFDVSDADIKGTAKFYEKYIDAVNYRKSKGLKTSIYGILTKIIVGTKVFKDFLENEKDNFPFPIMENYVPYLNTFKNDMSTVKVLEYKGKTLDIKALCNEFIKIIEK